MELDWLFNVTINDISVIHVTAHRCAGGLKKYLDLRSGSQRHRHFVGFFNVPIQAPTRDNPFHTVIPTHRPNKSPFTTRWGYGEHISTWALTGEEIGRVEVETIKERQLIELFQKRRISGTALCGLTTTKTVCTRKLQNILTKLQGFPMRNRPSRCQTATP